VKSKFLIILSLLVITIASHSNGQMKQIYKDANEDNEVRKFSFYTKSEGFIAFRDWIGFTTDGGATFQKKNINLTNVNYNGFSANVTFGFAISGVKAFDKDNIIVYGDYGLVPSILVSADGGNTFKLIYHQQSSATKFSYMVDMVFPDNGNTGYAIDEDRVLKTTNKGQSWTTVYYSADAHYKQIEAFGTTVAVVGPKEIIRSTNSAVSFIKIGLPTGFNGIILSATHLTATKIWLNYQNTDGYFYYSSDGGSSWTLKNNAQNDPVMFSKIKFFDDNLGYGLGTDYVVYKTTNGGKNWEPLLRETNFTYLGYQHYEFQFWDVDNFWVGGGYGLIESTNNGGGTPIPRPVFAIDLSTLPTTNTVKLVNYSKTDYTFQWLRNNIPLATTYDAALQRDNANLTEKITLVVTSGAKSVSLLKEVILPQGVQITSFTPTESGLNSTVTITGVNFTGANKVTFGGVNASSFTVNSPTTITAKVGSGKTGDVYVASPNGFSSLPGFTYLPPPTISSFTPTSAVQGNKITITGTNFVNVASVTFGGTPASSFAVVSPNQIDVIVGVGETGNVVVNTPGGTATLAGFKMLPTIDSFSPKSGTNGEIVTITGSGFLNTQAVIIGNVPVKIFKVNSTTSITATVGAASTGSVKVTNQNGTHVLDGFTYYNPPQIADFNPKSAATGQIVTITGTNFDTNVAGNIVSFGNINAKVLTATSSKITVEAPKVSTFSALSVTANGLSAYSKEPFIQSFSDGNSITTNAFSEKLIFPISTNPSDFKLYDFDGDGFLDIVLFIKSSTAGANEIAFYRNKGIIGDAKFDDKVSLFFQTSSVNFSAADIDGDGKPDLITFDQGIEGGGKAYLNTSTVGKIAFGQTTTFPTGAPYLDAKDFDGDGKPELICGNLIMKNTSSRGNISFANYDGIYGSVRAVDDFDGDGKLDLIVMDYNSGDTRFGIYKNTSTLDKISFVKALEVPNSRASEFVTVDVNGDHKMDIVVLNTELNQLNTYQNNGNNSFSFASPVIYQVGNEPFSLSFHDMDGDGLPDAIFNNPVDERMSIMKNISTVSNIKLAQPVTMPTMASVRYTRPGDIDQDGKPDIVFHSESNATIGYLKNKIISTPFIVSINPSIAKKGDLITITGNNFTNITSVTFGGQAAASFVVNSPAQITAVVGIGASGQVQVSSAIGSSELSGFSFGAVPIITSFSPLKAIAGASVTINGKNFSENLSDNQVFFGLAKAIITSATSTSLTVVVPAKATYSPILVNTNGLMGSSTQNFILKFAGDYTGFTEKSFSTPIRYHPELKYGTVADMDGDGKLDLINSSITFDPSTKIYRNTTVGNVTSFGNPVVVTTINLPERSTTADFDGDGKPDLVILTHYEFSIFKNTSVPGAISFGTRQDFNGAYPNGSIADMKIADMDGDGKLDVIIANYSSKKTSIFKNISENGIIKFGQRIDIIGQGWITAVEVKDFNDDGKPDLVSSSNSSNEINIYQNTSNGTQVSFGTPLVITTASSPSDLATGDLDDDGKPDLVVTATNLMLYRNTSTATTISFAPMVELAKDLGSTQTLAISDLDGDGKPEVVVFTGAAFVHKNITSEIGKFSFVAPKRYDLPGLSGDAFCADFDEDGKPDLITFSSNVSAAFLFSNPITKPILNGFSPASGADGTVVTLTGINFNSVTGVSFGGVPAASFTIESPTVIKAVVGTGGSGPFTLTSAEGSFNYWEFKYTPPPKVLSFSPTTAAAGETVTIIGKHFTDATTVYAITKSLFTIVDDQTIKVTINSFNFSGDITVQNNYGMSTLPGFIFVQQPQITNSSSPPYYLGAKVDLQASTGSQFQYQWSRNGVDIPGATTDKITVTQDGSYVVSLLHNQTRLSSVATVISFINLLPPTNFKVKAINKTCKSSTNGGIEITAAQNLDYTATITGPSYSKTSNFNTTLNITSLQAGAYKVCITMASQPSYQQCFDLQITEPKDLSLFSSVINNDQTITLNLGGSNIYHIELNGQTTQASSNQITLPLRTGTNTIKIYSDLVCQGILEKTVQFPASVTVYPNPFERILNIQLPLNTMGKQIKVDIFDLNGRSMYSKSHVTSEMTLALDLSFLTPGMYILKTSGNASVTQTKIFKK
jgi:hypothetical protein